MKYYENMLELHSERTFWKFDNDTLHNEDYELVSLIMEKYFKMFEEKLNTKLYALGRMGRHICVEDTDWNKRHYKSMKRYALKLEKMFVNEINDINFCEEE